MSLLSQAPPPPSVDQLPLLPTPLEEPYNIVPTNDLLPEHFFLRHPELRIATNIIRPAIVALRHVSDLRRPPFVEQHDSSMDLLDWLGAFFGFQKDNVRNQREHLVLHLANSQMRRRPNNVDSLDPAILPGFRQKLLSNYTSWCSYLGRDSNLRINDTCQSDSRSQSDSRRELLYASLYLLIWGESANLRFLPECICYVFHHMAMELNKLLEGSNDGITDPPFLPSTFRKNAFLDRVVKPLYETIKAEVESSRGGTAPYSVWRNYDDINEYFWSRNCFQKLNWPLDLTSDFIVTSRRIKHVGKAGFVEHRSFWNLLSSFNRLWVMLILVFQASIILAWEDKKYPWPALADGDVQVRLLSLFLTWSSLRFLRSLLNAVMQYRLVSNETKWFVVTLVMKNLVAAAWCVLFVFLYRRIWSKSPDREWSRDVNQRIWNFLEASSVFILPELLAVINFILPCNKVISCKDFHLLSWWFQDRRFVGRDLREGLMDRVKYALFWVAVLATKFGCSYFLQIKPMITTTKTLLHLDNSRYEVHFLHIIFNNSNSTFAVGLLWLPVILMYAMDLQIWYSLYSCLVGVLVGLFSRLGVIRDVRQLRHRFLFFASAIHFRLMHQELLSGDGTWSSKISDAIRRLKLRDGHLHLDKILKRPVEANKVSLLWNKIITIFREEDITSDREVELLELPKNSWDIRVTRWPCFLLSGELLDALNQAVELADAPDKRLWDKICKNEYRRCAVIEAYDSIKHLMLNITKYRSEEHSIVEKLFQDIDHSLQAQNFIGTFEMNALPQLHAELISLLELLRKPKKEPAKVVTVLQNLYIVAVQDFFKEKRNIDKLIEDGLAPKRKGATSDLFYDAVEFPDSGIFYRHVRRLHTILTSNVSMQNTPVNHEARRRLAFFSNFLFMGMPHAPRVEQMMAFSVLTPYNDEEVIYSEGQLRKENEDGITILFYLQTIYSDEWKNFMERMKREGLKDDSEIWTNKLEDLCLWASYRGQTLARTVRGMMYYDRALKMLSFLDSVSDDEIREGSIGLDPMSQLSESNGLYKGNYGATCLKYTYVVAHQSYGKKKVKRDPVADEILYLMRSNETLRVAYVDEVSRSREEKDYFSVLVKFDHKLQKEVEIFRIKLPGPMTLGGGKAENQNHGVIFTRGDAVQAIDMNQDNYFEEALKMRNLLEEFRVYNGRRQPSILGVREHIFTGSISSLAQFMSGQETSFVTLVQRVFANPLKVRMHYGHPDVFDRFWFLTRGGISKATRVLNTSEDIFAGFNCMLRGGSVTHHEYIQVGKGRYLGLDQVSMFEAKVACGNGEQLLSRDVYRLGNGLDIFRMLSFFSSTIGFFFNSIMVVLIVYAFLWGQLYLALSGPETITSTGEDDNKKALVSLLSQELFFQLGLSIALPSVVEGSLEHGIINALWDFIVMQFQLYVVFYTFSFGTRSHFFGKTILHGRAGCKQTGRGFVVHHTTFVENYRLYSRSHFVKAIELGLILVVYASFSPIGKYPFVYLAMMVECWFLVFSWIMAPFVFNPCGFDWLKTVNDFNEFLKWIWYKGGVLSKAEECWETWWLEEQDHLRTTGSWGMICEVLIDLRFFYFQYGIVKQLSITEGISNYLLSWIYVVVALGFYVLITYVHDNYGAKRHIYYRIVQFLVITFTIVAVIGWMKFTTYKPKDLLTSLLAFLPTGWGLILIAQVFRPFLKPTIVWEIVVSMARMYDILFGVIVMAPVAFFSWMPSFQSMQTRILFSEAFNKGLQLSQFVKGKRIYRHT